MTAISLTVNGKAVAAEVEPRQHLADFLREDLLLTATHLGCEHGVCGACTVLIDGAPARSCIAFPVALQGATITTLEGLAGDPVMIRLREAFSAHHALQCGYCTPGMLIMARDIVLRRPGAGTDHIRHELAGNLCRCTGYAGIVRAIEEAAAERRGLAPVITRGITGPEAVPDPFATPAAMVNIPSQQPSPIAAKTHTAAAPLEPLTNAIEIAERFSVPASADAVWAVLQDPARVVACLPGARLTRESDGKTIDAELSVSLGPISAAFKGTGSIQSDPANRSGVIDGRATDGNSASRLRARLAYQLRPGADEAQTEVALTIAYVLQGPLAQFSRGPIARDLAKRMTELFAKNLAARLADPSSAPRQSLSAASLIWAMVTGWLARIGGRR